MSSIQRLGQSKPTTASQIPFYDPSNGVDRRCSVQDLKAVILGDDTESAGWITQYENPNATGFSRTITPQVDGQSVWLLLMPTGAFAAGTLVMPEVSTCRDRQEVEVLCSQNLADLTVAGNGASINGAPIALTANEAFKLRFDAVTTTWYPAI